MKTLKCNIFDLVCLLNPGFQFAIFGWLFIANCLLFTANSFSQGTWTQKTSLPFAPALPCPGRLSAVAFTIGAKGYLGTGYALGPNFSCTNSPNLVTDNFWEYDPVTDSWTQKANFGGGPRWYAVGFSIGTKGYVGTGIDEAGGGTLPSDFYNDLWEYNPITNTWTALANCPGVARATACAFSVGGFGYIGTGVDGNYSYLQDMWKYDPATNAWSPVTAFPGGFRSDIDRAPFVIGNKAYLGTGYDGNVEYNDFWEYDYITNAWMQKANFPGIARIGATGFSICNKGFLGLGGYSPPPSTTFNDMWMYDPVTNSWIPVTAFPGGTRVDAPSFVINDKAYIGTGYSLISIISKYWDDLWEFSMTGAGITAASNTTICAGNSATLIASGGNSYLWSNGQTTSSIVVTPTATTTYTVSGTGSCGTGTDSVTVTVGSNVTAAAGPNSTICAGQNVTLTASGGTPYSWNTGAATSGIVISPTATSNYSVIVGSGGCADTASASVTVNPSPSVSVSGNTMLCAGDIATLTASGGTGYLWSNGSSAATINVSPSATTAYTVTTSNGFCSGMASVTVVVSPPPVVSVSGATICSGQTETLTASGGGSYSWSNGQTINPISVSPTSTSTYSVIVSIGSCSDTASATVTVNPSPSVSVSGNTTLCTGDIATLTASGSNNYSWSNGSSATTITISPIATTTYTVTTSNGSCASAASITVVVSPPPVASANGTTICAGQTAILTASGGGTYSWSNGATTSSITVTPTAAATYSVIVSIGSCADTTSVIVTVNPSPVATAWSNVTVQHGQSTTLAASGGGTYQWSNGSTDNPITVSPPVTTIYCVTITQNNCSDTACITVSVEPIDCSFSDDQLFVPDAFSPNNDTKNDVLGVYYPNPSCIREFVLIIYDRWGEKVFEADQITALWDGTYKGKLMNAAVFVYYMKVTFITGNETVRKGNISLIR
ncbi:MAG: T9SS type B sorting domain-containing protein [Bacteroidetes bacterium]|nr:MAG: T9SS type B sorting domain-containing protein [Bacteroidota bacterium]